jgi:2,7-dihydroxy-5-methyl-1-naphthoate 7-O-methyltransferase
MREMASIATPMSLRVAATLRLADRVGDAGATAADLAAGTGTCATALTRMLDHLTSIGVLQLVDGRYQRTDLRRQLRDDSDSELRDDLDINSAIGRVELAFVELLHTVTTGASAYPRRYGRGFWNDLAADLVLQESFDDKMTRRFREQAPKNRRRIRLESLP